MNVENFHQNFMADLTSTVFSFSHYYLPMIICLIGTFVIIRKLVKEDNGILHFRELILTLSLVFMSLVPMLNSAIAILMIVCIIIEFLDKNEKKEIFNFNKKDKIE